MKQTTKNEAAPAGFNPCYSGFIVQDKGSQPIFWQEEIIIDLDN